MDTVRVFNFAQGAVDRLPEPVGRGLFNIAGTIAGASNIKGVRQLRKNQARLRPGMGKLAARRLSMRAMRSYMRYYYETFRMSSLSQDQILARVREDVTDEIRDELAAGHAVTGAVMHAGNWDLAGAWSNLALAPVHTIVEKLEPPEIFEGFLAFREGLGMTIYPLVKGGGALHSLDRYEREGYFYANSRRSRPLGLRAGGETRGDRDASGTRSGPACPAPWRNHLPHVCSL